MNSFMGEFIGSFLLILLGDGIVANVALNKTKGNGAGFLAVTFGWAIAVFVGVYASAAASGAHLNPAVTIALAAAGKFDWNNVPLYIAAQFAGAMAGAIGVWIAYKQHFDATEDAATKLGVFCNSPAIPNVMHNLITEIIGTMALVLGVLFITGPEQSLGSLDALPVALLVLGIGLGLGGPTGYAINPARDAGPRIVHNILPIANKGSSNWSYGWIPVVGPIVGGLVAVFIFNLLHL